jgi:hypothetical protein
MQKSLLATLLISLSLTTQAAIVNVDFLVDATSRSTISGGSWINDSNYVGQQFSVRVSLNTDNYSPGTVDAWNGDSSIYSSVEPVRFGATPFDNEMNGVTPTLDYQGNAGYGPDETYQASLNYNQYQDSVNLWQGFSQISGNYYYDSASRYMADFDRDTIIELIWDNTPYTESDVTPRTLVDLLSLGMDQTYRFTQSVQESYYDNFNTSPHILLDGGIRYSGYATISSISAVPVPAAFWLFATGLVGLFGYSRKKLT